VLVDGDLVLYEAAAICLHLVDTHPQAGLAPALGSVERAHFYKWLVWMTNTMQATLMHYFYGDRLVDPAVAQIKVEAGDCMAQIDAHLAQHGGPWMRGLCADPYVMLPLDNQPGARRVGALLQRCWAANAACWRP
jgi:glutathione S-transferase